MYVLHVCMSAAVAAIRATRPVTGRRRTTRRTTLPSMSASWPIDCAQAPGAWSRPARNDCTTDSATTRAR